MLLCCLLEIGFYELVCIIMKLRIDAKKARFGYAIYFFKPMQISASSQRYGSAMVW